MNVLTTSLTLTVLAVLSLGGASQVISDASTPPPLTLYITECYGGDDVVGADVTAVIVRGGFPVGEYTEVSNSKGYVTFEFPIKLEDGDEAHIIIEPAAAGDPDGDHLYTYIVNGRPAGRWDINQPLLGPCTDTWYIQDVVISALYNNELQ